MNVLLTCAGRRNYLVEYFREALGGRGSVLAADAAVHAPALHEADEVHVVPLVHKPEYIDTLLNICRNRGVGLLLSLNDLELPILAKQKVRFSEIGVALAVSSPAVINCCFDKLATFQFLTEAGIATPRVYTSVLAAKNAIRSGEIQLPLVVKPRWGTASIGIEIVDEERDLAGTYRLVGRRLARSFLSYVSSRRRGPSVLIQEFAAGQEYGLDVVNDLEGRYVTTLAKKKLAMRAGETDRAITVEGRQYIALGERLGNSLKHVGNLDCDVFIHEGAACVLEMNPRFGGGYPFSHAAGANIPAAILAWAAGTEIDPSWLTVRAGVCTSKCDRLVHIPKP